MARSISARSWRVEGMYPPILRLLGGAEGLVGRRVEQFLAVGNIADLEDPRLVGDFVDLFRAFSRSSLAADTVPVTG